MDIKRVLMKIVAVAGIFLLPVLPVRASNVDASNWFSYVSENGGTSKEFNPVWVTSEFTVEDAKCYWKNQLSTQEQIIYEHIEKEAHAKNTEEFSFTINCPGIWHGGEIAVQEAIKTMVANASSAFSFDEPMYWCRSYAYDAFASAEDVTITMKLTPYYEGYYDDLAQVEKELEYLENEISQLSNTQDSFLLLEGIYTTLVQTLTYSFDSDFETSDANMDNGIVHTFAGALLDQYNHFAVCSAYSGLFMTICNDFGIPCIQISGVENEGLPHSFNYVCLGDEWYLVDATWGDQGGIPEWRYFLGGSKLAVKGHEPDQKLSCVEATSKFVAPKLAEKTFYQADNIVLSIDADEDINFDECDWKRDQHVLLNIKMTAPSWPVYAGLEYAYQEGGPFTAVLNGQILLNLDEDREVNIYLYNRYGADLVQKTVSLHKYPRAFYDEKKDLMDITCLSHYFTIQPILSYEANNYRIHEKDSNFSLYFTKEQLESMQDEIDLNEGEAHFKEFLLNYFGYLNEAEGGSFFYSFEEGYERSKALKKVATALDRKVGVSRLLLALEVDSFSDSFRSANLEFSMNTLLQEQEASMLEDSAKTEFSQTVFAPPYGILPETMYVYEICENGDYKLLGKAYFSKEGTLTIPNPGKRMVFYEKELLTKTQYFSRIIIALAATIVLIVVIIKLLKKRGCNTLNNMVN